MPNFATPIGMMIMGLIIVVIGLALLPTVISSAATAGGNAQIGSFGGVQGISDLLPLIFTVMLLISGVGMISTGAFKARG